MSEFGDWIREARSNLAAALAAGRLPRTERPPWLKEPDLLVRAVDEQERLLREGQVVWAALVQSNDHLDHRGWIDMPAFVIYGLDPALEEDPNRLLGPAQELFALRGGGRKTEDERSFGALLDDERNRATWRRVPASIAPGTELYGSAVLIVRLWLPSTTFAKLPLPLLVHPSRTGPVLPLPQQFWPEQMRANWIADAPEPPAKKEELRVGGLGFLFPIVLLGSLVLVPALVDRIGLWIGDAPQARHRWLLALLLPAIALGLVGWMRKKWRKSPSDRIVYEALEGHEIKLLSDDDLGLSLAQWAGVLALLAGVLRGALRQ